MSWLFLRFSCQMG